MDPLFVNDDVNVKKRPLASPLQLFNESTDYLGGDLDSSFSSDINSVSFQEISGILRAKPDINIFYRTPGSSSSKFSKRSSSVRSAIDHISQLPDSLLLRIFLYLNKTDLVRAMRSNRRFCQIAKDHIFWEFLNLQNLLLDDQSLHSLLDRHVKVLRLSSAQIKSPLQHCYWYDFQNMTNSKLTHLDLSHANFQDSDTLHRLLSRCNSLQALSLEFCRHIDADICREISKNRDLQFLDLVNTSTLSSVGIGGILCNCRRLAELNLGWVEWDDDAVTVICQFLPASLRRLNLSGFRSLPQMNDENIVRLCANCPNLEELDLADNVHLTEGSLNEISTKLRCLKVLTLSRCYGMEPMAFIQLDSLQVLNIFGCVTPEGVDLLRVRLSPTLINQTPTCTIARPTVGESVSSIWGQWTRDIY